ncbi:restriction endonuclease subunit S [Larkinella sp. GY13]|uniref:restriction endonuclease subunit S n=1 Tax=Larkinella sp. GY13 TaxID=3453720 RepID=UPI003EEC0D54
MELKEGYKQTEVGVIPEEWKVRKLNDLINKPITYGIVQPGDNQPNGVFMIRSQDYTNGWNPLETIMKVSFEVDKPYERSRVSKDDLLITVVGSNVGRMAIVPELLDKANISRSVARLSINTSKFDSSYCYHILVNNQNELVQANQVGGAQPVMNLKELGLFYIPLPPTKAEQTAIATALSDANALISRLETLIDKKRAIKQGAMQQLLKPKEGWVVKKLGELFSIAAGGDLDKFNYSSFKDDIYCYPIYSNSLLENGLYGYSSSFSCIENTITVTARGSIGTANARNHKYSAIGRVLILSPLRELDCFFMAEYINSKLSFVQESTGVPQLTAPQIAMYETVIPQYEEQTRIALILSDMDAEITGLEQKLSKYKRLKQGMMQELLTGKTRLV